MSLSLSNPLLLPLLLPLLNAALQMLIRKEEREIGIVSPEPTRTRTRRTDRVIDELGVMSPEPKVRPAASKSARRQPPSRRHIMSEHAVFMHNVG